MYSVMVVVHLIICGFLIFIVLIQSSKGAEMGAAFGGSSQTIFGSRGATTFMNKLTTGVAVAFMLSSLFLAILAMDRGSVIPDKMPARESPAKPFPDAKSGPVQEQPATTGEQGGVQDEPVKPVE